MKLITQFRSKLIQQQKETQIISTEEETLDDDKLLKSIESNLINCIIKKAEIKYSICNKNLECVKYPSILSEEKQYDDDVIYRIVDSSIKVLYLNKIYTNIKSNF